MQRPLIITTRKAFRVWQGALQSGAKKSFISISCHLNCHESSILRAISVISSWYNSLPFPYIKRRRKAKGTRKTSPYNDPGHLHNEMLVTLVYWADTPRAKFCFVFLSGTPAWSYWRNSWSFGLCLLTVWVCPSRFRSSPQFLLR